MNKTGQNYRQDPITAENRTGDKLKVTEFAEYELYPNQEQDMLLPTPNRQTGFAKLETSGFI